MITFKISEKEGLKYSKESGDINKIHLDKITGYNSIYGNKICHGTLVFLKYLDFTNKLKKISNQGEYFLKINYRKAFKYNQKIYISKNFSKIFQKNAGKADVEFYNKNKIDYEGKKLNLIRKFNFKNLKQKKNNYDLLRFILNNLSKYVGTVFPGKNSIIVSININYSKNFNFKNIFKIYSKRENRRLPIIYNKILFNNFIVEFETLIRPELLLKKLNVLKAIRKQIVKTSIPILIIGASNGIGKEVLSIFKHNKKIPIIATYYINKILTKQKNIKTFQLNLEKNINKLKKYVSNFKKLRIYYFASPKITISKNNKYNIKKFNDFYINFPIKIIKTAVKNNNYLEFFYPSTIFINNRIVSDYSFIKKRGEKIISKFKNDSIKINILRIDEINTKQNLSLFHKNLPCFTEKINNNYKYKNKFLNF